MNSIIDFFMDPLRLTLIIAGIVVVLAIVIFGRRSNKRKDVPYMGSGNKEFSFGGRLNDEILTEEEVVVLPPRKKESELNIKDSDVRISAKLDEDDYVTKHTKAFGPDSVSDIPLKDDPDDFFADQTVAKPEVTQPNKEDKPAAQTVTQNQAKVTQQKVEEPATTQSAASSQSDQSVKPKTRFVVLYVVATDERQFTGKEITESAQPLGLAFGKHNVFHYPANTAESGQSRYCLVNMTNEGSFPISELPTLKTNGVSLIMRLPMVNADGLAVFSNMLGAAQVLARKLGGDILDQTRVPLTPEIVTSLRSDIAHFESEAKQQQPVATES